jgi:hypothetical protein
MAQDPVPAGINPAVDALDDALDLLDTAILMVKKAIENNPSPDRKLQLMQRRTDLETRKNELEALRRNILQRGAVIAAPSSDVMSAVQGLVQRVSQARQDGATAEACLALAGQCLDSAANIVSATRLA